MTAQIPARCRATGDDGQRCRAIVGLHQNFCEAHLDVGPPLYFRSLEELWQRVEPRMASLDRGDSGILGVRLEAAVVFADLCGFSALGARHAGAPNVAAFVGHHYLSLLENWALTVSDINAVYIDKFVGDQIMLVVPGDRVPSTSLALGLARRWCAGLGPYRSSVGVHWGVVWFGDVGLRISGNRPVPFTSYTVMGQTVNIAARLCSCADGGEVLLFDPEEPRAPILEVPIDPGWRIDTRVVDRLRNIVEGPVELCRLRPPATLQYPFDLDQMLAQVLADEPQAVHLHHPPEEQAY